jgi:V8-like Glu-specific endopeptidase
LRALAPRPGNLLIKLATAAAVVIAAVLGAGFLILTAPAVTAPAAAVAAAGQVRTVGALFTLTSSGRLGTHFCTASVVHSPRGDLVLTAAHCVSARAAGEVAFVPDYANGKTPYGIWVVTRVVVDQAWRIADDPDDDFAFLVVSQPGSKLSLEQVTGGETLETGTPAGHWVQVSGYPDNDDSLISCDNTVLAYSPTQFQFDCGGFADGTSGSPLIDETAGAGSAGAGSAGAGSAGGGAGSGGAGSAGAGVVIGVIGGFQQGGLTPSVSYAARFSVDMAALYQTAVAESGS